MLPTVADLEKAFGTYFQEMDRCEKHKCYWALLHMVVALPDICAALQSPTGDAGNGGPYRAWCKDNFVGHYLSPEDRYGIRCALLHQGRTTFERGRYSSYSFVKPAPSGEIAHNLVTPGERNITLDVGEMARDTKAAMRTWFAMLQNAKSAQQLGYVQAHLPHLAKEKTKRFSDVPRIISIDTTFSSTG